MQNHPTSSGYTKARQNRVPGFTLIELLIIITLAGVLAAAALPSFRSFILSQRVKSASFDLVAALTQTRSEAIKRNANVSMTAAGGSWKNGWTIASGAITIGVKSAFTSLAITEKNSKTQVTFRGDGRLSTGSAAVYLTVDDDQSNTTVQPRCISLSLSGQASSVIGNCP